MTLGASLLTSCALNRGASLSLSASRANLAARSLTSIGSTKVTSPLSSDALISRTLLESRLLPLPELSSAGSLWTQQTRFNSSSTSKTEEATAQKDQEAAKDESDAESKESEKEQQLMQQLDEMKSKHEDIMDKYRRSLAESDNMRKRLTKQIEDAKVFGIQSFCKDLLDVADVLGKAVADVPEETLKKESQYLRDVHEGMKLTESQLLQVFKRHGLEKVAPQVGDKFDPNLHEALFQGPAPAGVEPGAIMDLQKVGYSLHGRTVRPALVGVAKK